MLPGSRSVYGWTMSMVTAPARKGDDHAAADPAGDPGPRRPGRAGTPLPHHPRRPHPHPLPDGAAQRPRPPPTPDRPAGPLQRRHRAPGAQPLPGWRSRRGAAPAPPRSAAPLPAWMGAGAGPGGRPGPPPGRGRQCAVELPAAGRLPGRPDRPSGGDRDGPDRAAPGRVCVQAAPLGAVAQGPGPAGVGKKRVRVEALLAAAASPVPPPAADLVPDPTLAEDLMPDDRRAVPFCDQLRRAVAPSRQRGRVAMVVLDNLGIHTPKGSRLLRGLLAELGEELVLVYTPTYDPDANRIV